MPADAAPVQSLEDVERRIETMQDNGLHVDVQVVGVRRPVDPELPRAAYRIIQEPVTNALKHVGADVQCRVRAEFLPGQVRITVHDDGPGFSPSSEETGPGLTGMRERARQLGGSLDIVTGASGTTLVAELPTR